MTKKPLVVAHRGYSEKYEDNSWTAILSAFEEGADVCEIDLHVTKDGKIFVNHDYYAGGKRIAEATLEEVKKVLPDNPDFEEILEFASEHGRKFLLEVKDRRLLEVLPEYLKDADRELFIVSSFDAVFLKEFKKVLEDVKICLLFGTVLESSHAVFLAKEVGAEFVLPAWESRHPYPDRLLEERWVDKVRESGLEVIIWHEERPEVLKSLIREDVYGICTNDPPLLRRLIDGTG